VLVHNEAHEEPRISQMDKALHAADPLTGLIVAAALVMPGKKLASVTAEKVLNRFKEKAFARGANREQIKTCAELGMSLEEFVGTGLLAMQLRAAEIGL
jgi:predicted hydrolase (HD superfamily)